MSSQKLDLELRGLWTSPNNLGAPAGALQIADNVVINNKSLIESRRGQTQYGTPLSIGSEQVNKLFNYSSSLITNYDDKLAYDSGSGVWVDYSGTYIAPDQGYKMRSLEALRNFYFTTNSGIYKIDSISSTPRPSGVTRALGGTGSITGTSGFLEADTAVAYRILWGYIDANNNLILGSPSQRLVVQNDTVVPADVSLSFLIPSSITTEYFYQIYRSNASATAADEPNDELQLVLQGNPTAAEITAKSFSIVDSTPYSLMRATIYTAPSQQGIENSNTQPPLALDMDVYKTCAFYANTKQKQSMSLALIGVDSPSIGYITLTGTTTNASNTITILTASSSVIIQDLTFTADNVGYAGNEISITYTDTNTGALASASVVGTAITVSIHSGHTQAATIKTAIDGLPAAAALVNVTVSGTGTNTQTSVIQTFLTGGYDTSLLRQGMRSVGAGIPTNSTIVSINSPSQVTISNSATASASVSIEFQDRFSLANVNYWAGSIQDVATNTFLVDTSSTPGQNIDATALNLIEIVNTSSSNTTVYGYYISGVEDLPGQMLFEERSIGGAIFTVNSTAGLSFSPTVPDITTISSISVANPTVITSTSHGLTTGDFIKIYNTNSTPIIDGEYMVTVLSSNTFSVSIDVTVSGSSGYWVLSNNVVQSNNEIKQNRVYVSKPSQVESVPVFRFFDIGSANFPIQRVVALRDGIFFFKQDGIYRISGESFESFVVTLIDNTVTLKAPESAVAFNNQVFCFTTQGICAVTDAGVQIMSVPIENILLELSSEQFTYFSSASFGVAYESARQYMFFTVTQESDQFATQAFIYNSLTDSWTRWIMDRTCGIVNPSVNKLFMAQTDTGQVLIERKSYTNADYADEQFPVTITSVSGTTIINISDATNVVVGMTIKQGGRYALITRLVGTQLTIESTRGFIAGSADVYTPIDNTIQWLPLDVDNPGILKQFSELSLFFKNAAFESIDATFSTNVSTVAQTVPIINNSPTQGWGELIWGNQAWGGTLGGQSVIRTYVPREKQRGSWLILSLSTQEAFTGFSLQGVSLIFNPMSSRIK